MEILNEDEIINNDKEIIPNSLIYGDCLKVMPKIKDKSIDMILCDLPYDCGKTCNKWDKKLPMKELWEQYNRIIKEDGIICLFSQEPFTSYLILSNPSKFRYKLIWEKESPTGFLNCNYKPLTKYEEILIFSNYTVGSASKNKIRYYPQGVELVNLEKHNNPNSTWRKNKGYSVGGNKLNSSLPYIQKYKNYPNDILKFARDKNAVHPTQKPVALLEYLIKTYTNEGEIVLDNCAGSGSTAIACLNTNRKGIMIEKDPKYFNAGCSRIKQYILDNNISLSYNQINDKEIICKNL